MKLLLVAGTRPETIKMAPVLLALARQASVQAQLCLSGQHGRLAQEPLRFFGLAADHVLNHRPCGNLADTLARMTLKLGAVMDRQRPDRVLVHGDTLTAAAAAQAAYFRRIPVGHVEAGLRTYRRDMPWPEETIRCLVDDLCDLLFAPTETARDHLLAERTGGRVIVTGNTGIDALRVGTEQLEALQSQRRRRARKLILVTGHRRENIGEPLLRVCAVLRVLARRGDADIVLPVHPNPQVSALVREQLADFAGVRLVPPLGYGPFLSLLRRADLVLSDSGGVQEEAVALGRPLLILRDTTERPEALRAAGTTLVGTDPQRLLEAAEEALAIPRMAACRVLPNPFGDGLASERIVDTLLGRKVAEFSAPAEHGHAATAVPHAPLLAHG